MSEKSREMLKDMSGEEFVDNELKNKKFKNKIFMENIWSIKQKRIEWVDYLKSFTSF